MTTVYQRLWTNGTDRVVRVRPGPGPWHRCDRLQDTLAGGRTLRQAHSRGLRLPRVPPATQGGGAVSGLRQQVSVVESVFASKIREINALEEQIVIAEDDADAKLWEQAEKVVEQLRAGMTQRDLAAEWINARTGQSYSQMHVSRVKQVVETFTFQLRPRFRDAYNKIANRKPSRTQQDDPPFHWLTALGAFRSTVERTIATWPDEVRQLVPDALRNIADELEGSVPGDGRRSRAETSDTDDGDGN